jgi:hypothetical protein
VKLPEPSIKPILPPKILLNPYHFLNPDASCFQDSLFKIQRQGLEGPAFYILKFSKDY